MIRNNQSCNYGHEFGHRNYKGTGRFLRKGQREREREREKELGIDRQNKKIY